MSLQRGRRQKGASLTSQGVTTEQSFYVNRSADSPVASTCAIARAFANNTDYMWSAYDDMGGVPVTVELIAVDSQDEDNFTCLSLLPGRHIHSLVPRPYSYLYLLVFIFFFLLHSPFSILSFPIALPLSCIIVKGYTSKKGGGLGARLKYL